MNSGPEVNQCPCCKECRPLEPVEVPVVELNLLMMTVTYIKTGQTKEMTICGICAEKVLQGVISVMGEKDFIVNGKHARDVYKQNRNHHLL